MNSSSYRIVIVLVVGMVVAACANGGEAGDLDPAAAAPTTTAEPLVYVVMGNSIMFSGYPSVMSAYGDILREDLGVEVELRDHTVPGQFTQDFLEQLQSNEVLRADLAEADVVFFLVPNGEWKEPSFTIMGEDERDPADCGGDDGLDCLRSVAAQYSAMAELAFAELTTLVDPSEVLIRVFDNYQFTPGEDDEAAVETLAPLLRESEEYVELVAARYGIPVAQVFDEFMGPDGAGIPEHELLVAADGVHPTGMGAKVIAQLVRELGYEPAAGGSADAITGQYATPEVYVTGEQWGAPIPGAGYEHERGRIIRHSDSDLSDDRVDGDFDALADIDIYVEGDRTTGIITMTGVTITNGGGTWEGTGVGTTTWTTSQPGHLHNIHFTLLGTGDYEGLQFRYHVEGIDFPWTVTGRIEPVDA